MTEHEDARALIDFWREAGPARWFARDAGFDAACAAWLPAHHRAARRELDAWAATPDGALALLLLLDQIPRNVFRGSAHAYATDPLARHFARGAIDAGFDLQVEPALRVFCYLPFEHSEAIDEQRLSLELHARLQGEDADRWARLHLDIIERFGRFPHRNAALGRATTAAEQAFLEAGGFAG
ncbi:DUF924 family protein [Lysobacter humi (ex Lee et al. 2017)]